jgi:hypothetical protein
MDDENDPQPEAYLFGMIRGEHVYVPIEADYREGPGAAVGEGAYREGTEVAAREGVEEGADREGAGEDEFE